MTNQLRHFEGSKETTYEICPYCEDEVAINSNEPSQCPICKEVILPCSTCYEGCNWTKEHRCWRFPL